MKFGRTGFKQWGPSGRIISTLREDIRINQYDFVLKGISVVRTKRHLLTHKCDLVRTGNEPWGTKRKLDIFTGLYQVLSWYHSPWGCGIRVLMSRDATWTDDYKAFCGNAKNVDPGPHARVCRVVGCKPAPDTYGRQ